MGRVLIIKNANFAANKVSTVNFLDDLSCFSLSLNKHEQSMENVGDTATLIATVYPTDTPDTITWSSSDDNIVSVSNGVLTQTGTGTVVITATCNGHSDTCTITAIQKFAGMSYEIGRYAHKSDVAAEDYVYVESAGSAHYAVIYKNGGDTKRARGGDGQFYPIPIPNVGTHIAVQTVSGVRITLWFVDKDTACDASAGNSGFEPLAKFISGDASAYDGTVATGDRIVEIPQGASGMFITMHYSAGDITSETVFATNPYIYTPIAQS